MSNKEPILDIRELSISFHNHNDIIPAGSGCSFSLQKGTCTAIIGESGCGKSIIAHAILRILPNNARISGNIKFKSYDLLHVKPPKMENIRGREIGIMFQSPDRALNPISALFRQVQEPLITHQIVPITEHHTYIHTMLKKVGFSDTGKAAYLYPCQCSGGMNQRAITAIVLSLKPDLVIADEPTKGLDSERISDVQNCIQKILAEKRTVLLITHDIRLAKSLAQETVVMYAGQIIESGPTDEILYSPLHPYTKGLIQSTPEYGFQPIPGFAPPLTNLPPGCRFAPRCTDASEMCYLQHVEPVLHNGRMIRCHRY